MELESKLGEEIDKELEAMAPAELVRVQVGYLIFVSPALSSTPPTSSCVVYKEVFDRGLTRLLSEHRLSMTTIHE